MAALDVTDATFQRDVLEASRETPVVVDFWAAWCQPCLILGPVLERLAEEPDAGFRLAKVDVDANPNVSAAFQIQSIPAVKAFVDGALRDGFVGVQPEHVIRQWLKGFQPDPAEDVMAEARRFASKGNYEEVRRLLEPIKDRFDADTLLRAVERVEREVPEVKEGVPEAGLERLLQAAPSDTEAKEAMLAAFEVLGDDEPATREFRRRLTNALF